jgi:exonuclease SbcD
VPTFQPLESIKGDWPTIKTRLQALKQTGQTVWLEIVYDGVTIIGDLAAQIAEITNDSALTVLRIKNQQLRNQTLQAQHSSETLDELDELQVFERCMTTNQIPDAQQATLKRRYLEVLEVLHP